MQVNGTGQGAPMMGVTLASLIEQALQSYATRAGGMPPPGVGLPAGGDAGMWDRIYQDNLMGMLYGG